MILARRLADHALGGVALSVALWLQVEFHGSEVVNQETFLLLGTGSLALYLGIRLGLARNQRETLDSLGQGYTARGEGVDILLEGVQESETLRDNVETVHFHLTEAEREQALDESPTFAGAWLTDEAKRGVRS